MADEGEDQEVEFIHGDADIDDDIDENVTDDDSVEYKRWKRRRHAKEPTPKERIHKNLTVVVAVFAGTTVAIVKFLAAAFTGSSAMFSEGIHSLVDAANDSLMLIGSRASKKPPTISHPFGYGRLLYFYSFVVSLVICVFGGVLVIVQGVQSFAAGGAPVEAPIVNYLVLALGCVLEGYSLHVALRDVNRSRGELSIAEYIHKSKAPVSFTVLLEDTAAVLGMVIAFLGILLSETFGEPRIDSAASILIGCVMFAVAIMLLHETRSLLIGEGLDPKDVEEIEYLVEQDPAVIKCGRILSMYESPDDLVLAIDVTFDDELEEGDILKSTDRIEAAIVDEYPQCSSIFIEVESLNLVYRQRNARRQELERIEQEEEEDEDD